LKRKFVQGKEIFTSPFSKRPPQGSLCGRGGGTRRRCERSFTLRPLYLHRKSSGPRWM